MVMEKKALRFYRMITINIVYEEEKRREIKLHYYGNSNKRA
jgi:hypothetical protein